MTKVSIYRYLIANFVPRVSHLEISARRLLLNIAVNGGRSATKLNATKCLITEDPFLMFSIVKEARDQTQPVSLLARPRGTLGKRLSNGT